MALVKDKFKLISKDTKVLFLKTGCIIDKLRSVRPLKCSKMD